MPGESLARDFAVDLLQSVEPNAILITAGDNDAFPLWYAQEVEGVRKDVLLPNQSLLNTKWHLRQLQRRAAFPFDSANAADPYRGRSWPDPPTDPPFDLTMEELDALPPYFQITERSIFRVGEVTAVLEAGGLERSDLATLQLMRDNLGKRPIYFSRTTAAYPDRLGLTSFLLGQGLARKLLPHPIEESDTTAMVPGLGWVDVPRTSQLLFDVYHYESAAKDRPRGWIDIPSEGIMALYGVTYLSFSQAPGLSGRDLTGAATPSQPISPRALGTSARESSTTPVTPETPRASRQPPERTEESGATPDFEPEVHISPGSRLEVASKPGIHPYRPHIRFIEEIVHARERTECPTGKMPVPTEPNARGHPPVISRAVRIIQVGR